MQIKLNKNSEIELFDLQKCVSEVSEDFTLYDLFKMVADLECKHPNIVESMGMPHFWLFWERIQDEPDDKSGDVKYLELYWHVDGFSDEIEMSNLMGFHGRGKFSQEEINCWSSLPEDNSHLKDDACGYAIEFSPVNDLKNLPIKMDIVADIRTYNKENTSMKKLCKIEIYPTLWCFIASIFFELTFCGYTPEDVEGKADQIFSSIDDIKEGIADCEPLENLLKDLKGEDDEDRPRDI